jgi:hypothetical protein
MLNQSVLNLLMITQPQHPSTAEPELGKAQPLLFNDFINTKVGKLQFIGCQKI